MRHFASTHDSSTALKDCLTQLGYEPETPGPKSQYQELKPFVPKSSRFTSKERKLLSLQGSDFDPELLTQSQHGPTQRETTCSTVASDEDDHRDLGYPFCAGTTAADSRVGRSHKTDYRRNRSSLEEGCSFGGGQTGIEAHGGKKGAYSDMAGAFSARKLKQLYDLKSCRLENGALKPNPDLGGGQEDAAGAGARDVQEEYNKTLLTLREKQKNYSDIFGHKDVHLQDAKEGCSTSNLNDPSSILPNRPLREVRKEIQPTAPQGKGATWSAPMYGWTREAPNGSERLSARGRYAREFSSSLDPQTLSINEADVFGRPITEPGPRPVAKIALFRLREVPQSISEEQLIEGIKRCHCYAPKLWLPYNVLLGHHKGVGSVIVRESSNPAPCRTSLVSRDEMVETDSNRSETSCVLTSGENAKVEDPAPFETLQNWFKSVGITATLEELTVESSR